MARAEDHIPTYDDLLEENTQLRNAVSLPVPEAQTAAVFDLDVDHNCNMFERYIPASSTLDLAP
jgi:hypothetical protein